MSKVANLAKFVLVVAGFFSLFSFSPTSADPKLDPGLESITFSSSQYQLGSEIRVSNVTSPDPSRSNTAIAYNSKNDEYP